MKRHPVGGIHTSHAPTHEVPRLLASSRLRLVERHKIPSGHAAWTLPLAPCLHLPPAFPYQYIQRALYWNSIGLTNDPQPEPAQKDDYPDWVAGVIAASVVSAGQLAGTRGGGHSAPLFCRHLTNLM